MYARNVCACYTIQQDFSLFFIFTQTILRLQFMTLQCFLYVTEVHLCAILILL